MDDFELEDVQDVAGNLEEGRTVSIELVDGPVVVARVTQLQEGEMECPDPECLRRFDSERAVKTHIGKMHPELRRKECPTCGEEFAPTTGRPDQVYCSQECYLNDPSGRTTLECQQCGEEFSVKASHADDRRHCSRSCRAEAMRGPRPDNSREERECPECGEAFEVYPSQDQTFCSVDCASDSRWGERTCPMCEQSFAVRKARDKTFCSRPCHYEHRRRDDRPSGDVALVNELVDEHGPDTGVDRARAHLLPDRPEIDIELLVALADSRDYEQAVTRVFVQRDGSRQKSELVERLLTIVCDDAGVGDHVTPAAVERAVEGADTILEVTQELRASRNDVRALVNRLGVDERFSRDAAADAAREQLGLAQEGSP